MLIINSRKNNYNKDSNRLIRFLILVTCLFLSVIVNNLKGGSKISLSGNVRKYDNPLPLYGERAGDDIVIFVLDASSSMQDYGIHEQTADITYWDSVRFKDGVFRFANVSYGKEGEVCPTCRSYAKESGIVPAARFILDLPVSLQECLANGGGYCSVAGEHNDYFTGEWAHSRCNSYGEPCSNWQQDNDGACTGIFYPGTANIVVMKAAMMRMLEQFNDVYRISAFTASDNSIDEVEVCGDGVLPLRQHGLLFNVDDSKGVKDSAIKALHARGNASLGEILYEVYLYLKGGNSHLNPGIRYKSPIKDICDRVHVIVISDGVYERSMDTPPVVDEDGDGVVSDEVAYKLAHEDLSSELEGDQKATVHSMYYVLKNAPDREYRVMGQAVMRDIAESGEGNYYEPSDMLIIEDRLDEVVGDSRRARLDAYTAGAQSWDYYGGERDVFLVRSNTFNNLGSTDKYIMEDGVMEGIYPEVEPVAESGKRLRQRSYQSRVIFTVIPDKISLGVVELKVGAKHWQELREYLKKVWGENPAGLTIEDIVDYIRGNDYYESWQHGNLRARCWYGDCGGWKQAASWQRPIFSSDRPLPTGMPDESLEEFAERIKQRRKVVFVPANNGIIHCFDATNMEEKWAFIPPAYLSELLNYSKLRWYQKDLTPQIKVFDLKISTPEGVSWETLLIGNYGLTVAGVFALKITDHQKPEWLWQVLDTGTYLNNSVSYYYQMGMPGYPNKQGGALLIFPSGYGQNVKKRIFIRHPLSSTNIKVIDLDDGQPGNQDSEIIMIRNKIFACEDPAFKNGDILVYDNEGRVYDISICDIDSPVIKFVSKPTVKDKGYGMWNMLNSSSYDAGLNYIAAGDGMLLLKEHLKDVTRHSISISAPHSTDFPSDEGEVARYEVKDTYSWLTVVGGNKGKKHILIELPHDGERLISLVNSSTLSSSYHLGKTVYYKGSVCDAKIPYSSLMVFPRMYFSIIKDKPWIELRSEYLVHKNMTAFIDVNGDGIINDGDLIEGRKVYGKSFDGFISDIRQHFSSKRMMQHLNIILIEAESGSDSIYRSRLEHLDIAVEPSYEVVYRKLITVPKIDKDEYPSLNKEGK